MVIKSSFEPKDARITFEEEDYHTDEEKDVPKDWNQQQPRKRKTGTQALVEFLNTTCPEEFQKDAPKRSSALFFRKRKSTTTTTNEKQRKNYIEIIANPFNFKPKNIKPSPSSSHPILPMRKGAILPKRNVGGINNTPNMLVPAPLLSKGGGIVRPSLQPQKQLEEEQEEDEEEILNVLPRTQSTTPLSEAEDDIIEKGLKQRLNYYKESQLQKPSDLISKSVAQEHTMALEVVFSVVNNHQQQEEECDKRKSKTRHIQVQTMPYKIEMTQGEETLMAVQQKLEQEKLLNSKLEATIEEMIDHYETLCGLAYSKLRQVWEEKVRWENACFEAKERCWHQHQQQILGPEL
ncbi:hypothetical protein INT46_005252 [Mucor plumbeus]|uniref:Uncharacterized protein n=1 Tax=Mucor plumbeus TaxID=97098 RepID=A0A8H7RMJ7_9FUNG|nr:hypothetical protein INT46_005252 [Mucor plumbeus]